MSLLVWLPLSGNLKNYGVSNITISKSTEVSLDTIGKIGKCASCDTSGKTITATVPGLENILANGQSYSVCAWIKWLNHGTSGYIWQTGTSNQTGLWWTNTSSNPRIVWNENDGGKRCANNALATDYTNWHHYTFIITKTSDGQITAQHYTDGIRSTSYPGTSWNGSSQNIPVGNDLILYPYTAAINDFRIYSHALSPAEVHEISQGLVLHYKLDHIVQPNLLTGNINNIDMWTADGVTKTQDGNSIKVVDNGSSARRIYNIVSNVWTTSGAKFTISFDAKASSNGQIIRVSRSIADYAPNITVTTDWKHYSVQLTNTASVTDGTLSIQSATTNGTFWIRNIKLERGDVETRFIMPGETDTSITDSSGYGHNGTILGSPIISSDTARYTASTSFPANADGILSTYPIALWNNAFTYSFWIKPSGENGGRSVYAASYNGTSCSIEKTTGNKLRFYWNGSPDLSTSSLTITDGIWQHITIVKEENKTTVKCYYNGVLKDTFTNTFSDKTFNGNLRIARDTRGDATSYTGMMSDFRIYCTALSATDVKQLYEVGAKVDNKGNLHTYEINEHGQNKLKKTGVFYNYATEPYIQLADGSCWKLMLFHYVDGGHNLFTSSNATYNDGFGLYSRLRDIDNFKYDNKYEFYVIQDGTEFRWTQTSKPTATSISGKTVVSGYNDPVNGLAKPSSLSQTYIGYSSWWGACGCWTSYSTGGKTGIPGFGSHDGNGICTTYLALYTRIDKITYRNASNAHYANNLIEL